MHPFSITFTTATILIQRAVDQLRFVGNIHSTSSSQMGGLDKILVSAHELAGNSFELHRATEECCY